MPNLNSNNFIKNWWRSIDQLSIISIIILIALSLMLVTTTSSSVAETVGLTDGYFATRQVIYLLIAIVFILFFSSLSPIWIKRISVLGFLFTTIMLVLVKLYGYEIKGAVRWIRIVGFSYQPSEFMKPFFCIVTGWILSLKNEDFNDDFPSFTICIIMYIIVAMLLIIQPDFGMLALITVIFTIQLFIAGMPMVFLFCVMICAMIGTITSYLLLPHVATRIDNFIDPTNSANYQITKSILAFEQGGLWGKGPGEGAVKRYLPDSHSDFIFAVAGEEFGAIICTILVIIFTFIVTRNLMFLRKESDKFIQFSAVGLITQFGLQASINMGVTLDLLPTKGMTLPFISYGGSSTLAMALAMGIVLGLTKKKPSLIKYKNQYI